MKKRGFTLVELLAVIAILAILVIVAMPNVLGMFNEAKANTFVTEVQKYIDAAKTAFVNDALSNQGKAVYYSSEYNDELKTAKLDMDGSKEYFIEMDRHGDFKRIVIKDDSFCYDIYASGATINFDNSNSKLMNSIDKSSVNVNDVWNSETTDSIVVSHDGSNFKVKGCEAVTTIEGKSENVITNVVKIDDIEYKFIPGMTWDEWFNSDYSKNFKGEFFNGDVYFDSFRLHRNSTVAKSTPPVILGTVEETDSGAIVKIKMRLDLSVIIFMFFWFSFVLIACMDSLNIIPLLMLIVGILMITIPTKKEKNKEKEKLEELLKD